MILTRKISKMTLENTGNKKLNKLNVNWILGQANLF